VYTVFYKSSAVAEMGNRDHKSGRKEGDCCAPFAGGSWLPV